MNLNRQRAVGSRQRAGAKEEGGRRKSEDGEKRMVAYRPNLFSSLYRWARRQDENFTTEGFTWLLGYLVREEPEAGRAIVSWVCLGNCHHPLREPVLITTQQITPDGKPDIRIDANELVALVEVKKGSGLSKDQLPRYRAALNRMKGDRRRRLILLTRDSVALARVKRLF